jgi:large subunit ribosomal protein L25
MRNAGAIPAVLYGHHQESVSLSVAADRIEAALRHGSRVVYLAGALTEQAFIRELQWDAWGKEILHVDLVRISAHEKVEVRVLVELRGESPGVKLGGIIEQHVHGLDIECEANSIPEKVQVNINHLQLDQSITIGDLVLPENVRVLDDPATVLVHCGMPAEVAEEEAAAAAEIEPEVIGRKKAEEEEES